MKNTLTQHRRSRWRHWWRSPPLALSRAQQPTAAPPALELLPVQGNVYMLAGAGGNITLMTGKEGVLMVDTGLAASAARVTAEIRKLNSGPIRWVINTHFHPDHVGGNEAIAALPADPFQPLRIVAHENVLNRMTTPTAVAQGPDVVRGLPVDEYFTPIKDIHFNGEAIVLYHEAKAHTDGDSVVLFRGSDVVSTGDIFTPDGYPFIDLDNGGSVQGEIAALNHILRPHRPCENPGRRHLRHPGARTDLRRSRRGRIPRHGGHRSRSRAGRDQQEDDARAGEGGQAHA